MSRIKKDYDDMQEKLYEPERDEKKMRMNKKIDGSGKEIDEINKEIRKKIDRINKISEKLDELNKEMDWLNKTDEKIDEIMSVIKMEINEKIDKIKIKMDKETHASNKKMDEKLDKINMKIDMINKIDGKMDGMIERVKKKIYMIYGEVCVLGEINEYEVCKKMSVLNKIEEKQMRQ